MPLLLLLFIGSGCAALIYEIVWFQLLQLVIGSSVVSLGVLLGTFMGGMCLGSLLLPRVVSSRHHPLRVYAALELGVGIIGLLILWGMPLIGGIYTAWAGPGDGSCRAARYGCEAGARRVGDLRRHRPLRDDRARGRSDLDADSVAALRRHGLHVLADPRRLPHRVGYRQQPRRGDRPRPQ